MNVHVFQVDEVCERKKDLEAMKLRNRNLEDSSAELTKQNSGIKGLDHNVTMLSCSKASPGLKHGVGLTKYMFTSRTSMVNSIRG